MTVSNFDSDVVAKEEGGSPLYTPRIEVDAALESSCHTGRCRPQPIDEEVLQAMEQRNLDSSPPEVLNGGGDDAVDREVEVSAQEETLLRAEQPRVECKSPIGPLVELFHDNVDAFPDVVGEVGHFMGYAAKKWAERRVIRIQENDDGSFSLYEMNNTITISEDNVSFEIVTTSQLRHQSTTKIEYIAQTPFNESTVYVRVSGKKTQVSTKLDKKCQFRMELYQGGSNSEGRVCVIRNDHSHLVIDRTASWSTELGANEAAIPVPGEVISNPDEKFFYWINHPHSKDEEVFQSVTNEKLFMAVGDNDSLYLKTFNSVGDVDSTGRFKVINGK